MTHITIEVPNNQTNESVKLNINTALSTEIEQEKLVKSLNTTLVQLKVTAWFPEPHQGDTVHFFINGRTIFHTNLFDPKKGEFAEDLYKLLQGQEKQTRQKSEPAVINNTSPTNNNVSLNNNRHKADLLHQERHNELKKINFNKHLEVLTKKQQKMYEKSLNNSNYTKAAQEAKLLCEVLTQAQNKFLSLDESNIEKAKITFKNECLHAINKARTVLDKHREWRGQIKEFLLDILSALSFGLTKKLGLFGKTDSGTKLDSLEQELKNNKHSF